MFGVEIFRFDNAFRELGLTKLLKDGSDAAFKPYRRKRLRRPRSQSEKSYDLRGLEKFTLQTRLKFCKKS